MLSSFRNMFRIPDLRNKIIFTLFMIGLYRLGANVTVPGIDFNAVQKLQAEASKGGVLSFLRGLWYPMSPPPLLAGAGSGFGGVGGVGGPRGLAGLGRLLPLLLPLPLPLRDEARARTRSAVHDPLGGEE